MKALKLNIFSTLPTALVLMYTPFAKVQAEDAAKGEVGLVNSGVKNYYDGEAGIGLGLDQQWTDQSTMAYSVLARGQRQHDSGK
jgi:hypothetical protein